MNVEQFLSARDLTKNLRAMGKRTLEVLRGVNFDRRARRISRIARQRSVRAKAPLQTAGRRTRVRRTRGEIFFNGRSRKIFRGQLTHFRNRRVGFVFQAYHLLPGLTALENVCLASTRRQNFRRASRGNRGRELLSRVGLAGRIRHKPSRTPAASSKRRHRHALHQQTELL